MAKRALLVGCNYPGTSAELHGCVNDVTRMRASLLEKFGFEESDVTVMIDTDPESVQPTGKNIKEALRQLIDASTADDVLFFHYSGHGTQVPAESGDKEDDGEDEAIVPTDLNLLTGLVREKGPVESRLINALLRSYINRSSVISTDDDFRLIFNTIADGVHFTFVSDSCHSGGLLDSVEVQIGQDDDGEVGCNTVDRGVEEEAKEKNLSLEALTQMLSERTGHEVQPGQIRTTLYDMFADDSSPTVKVFVNLIEQRIQQGFSEEEIAQQYGEVGSLAYSAVKSKLDDETVDNDAFLSAAHSLPQSGVNMSGHANAKPDSSEQLSPATGVLVSGCQSNETSADANPTGDPSQAYGALSNGIQEVLAQYEGPISNAQLVSTVRKLMKQGGFEQHPCLSCSDENVTAPFICERIA